MRERSQVFEAEIEAVHERYRESLEPTTTERKVVPNLVLTKG